MSQQQQRPPAGYAKVCGVLGLILAILGFIVPIYGVLLGSAAAALLGVGAMLGGANGLGIATMILVVLNCVISPSFWLAVGFGDDTGIGIFSWVSVTGVAGMLVLLVRPQRA